MRKIVILAAVVVLISITLSGCDTQNKTESNIEIISYDLHTKNYGYYGDGMEVTGTAKNNADHMQRVTIHGKFYDKDDVYLGGESEQLSDNVRSYEVPAGYTWDFKLAFIGDYATQATKVIFSISTN